MSVKVIFYPKSQSVRETVRQPVNGQSQRIGRTAKKPAQPVSQHFSKQTNNNTSERVNQLARKKQLNSHEWASKPACQPARLQRREPAGALTS